MQSAIPDMNVGAGEASQSSTVPSKRSMESISARLNKKLLVYKELEDLQFDDMWVEKINLENIVQAKSLLYKSFVETLQDHKPEVPARTDDDVYEELENELQKYSEHLDSTLYEVQSKIAEGKQSVKRSGELSKNLKMMQITPTRSPDNDIEVVKKKLKAAKVMFTTYKRLLNDLIEDIFPDKVNEFTSLMRALAEAAFESEEPYVKMDDFESEAVNLLLSAKVIKQHPYDRDLARLVINI